MNIKWSLRLVGLLAAAALVAILVLWGPSACTSYFSANKQVNVSKGQAGASINSGAAAMKTVSDVESNTAEIQTTVKGGIDEIHAAPAGNSNDAADRAVCGLRSYRDSERCARLRGAGAGVPAAGNAAR